MSQITLAIRHAPHSEWLFRWQATVIAALAGGSLTAALLNLGAAVALAVTRSTMSQVSVARGRANRHA
ncbi:hypothetical protein [Porphyrobacter sp. ULC335]|uniref:hypothetical protein n=1 Tax=Porphyrobacter sp. ULC335 TaxID=2854260 RepID=UPI00222085AC|nr:hypothetical protein [Porphyrobacter sp. ULC335]UYV15411.1 hypothetical protein KVF90_15065 [Porphyrobacter sp. ULC335]